MYGNSPYGYGYVSPAAASRMVGSPSAGPSGADFSSMFGTPVRPVDAAPPRFWHLPNWGSMSDVQRIATLRKIVESYGRDPRFATLAMKILADANVQTRDHRAQAAALLRWVQKNIRYVNEPGERLQSPDYTLRVGYGDCFSEGTLVLTEDYMLLPIEDVRPGIRIWGYDKWSTVTTHIEKGPLPVTSIQLNNGSTFTVTEDHKVYVRSCELHGPSCPDLVGTASNCKTAGRKTSVVRITVAELREGMELLTPERLPFGREHMDPDRAYVEGLFLSDGWCNHQYTRKDGTTTAYDFSISGKDGHPKEAQKREVERICAKLGIPTRWDSRSISVSDSAWADRLHAMGSHAWEKAAASIDLDEAAAAELLRGIMADSGRNTHGPNSTFTTTSATLAVQTRLLWKMFGRTCGESYIVDHGGLGKHPIWRLTPRSSRRADGAREKRLRVKSITRGVATVPCYDISTDDHYVYLPGADVTVSNCDDEAILLATLCTAVALPVKFVLSGIRQVDKSRARWIEGEPWLTGRFLPVHVYLMIQLEPFNSRAEWVFADPTLDVPLGWDVIQSAEQNGGKIVLPEMRALSGLSGASALGFARLRHVANAAALAGACCPSCARGGPCLGAAAPVAADGGSDRSDQQDFMEAVLTDIRAQLTPRRITVAIATSAIFGALGALLVQPLLEPYVKPLRQRLWGR